MTFVGKILVILIMAFSLVFLGVSTVVFTTATNWKDKSDKQKAETTKISGQLNDAKTKLTTAEGQFKAAVDEQKKQLAERDSRLADLKTAKEEAEDEMTKARALLQTAQENAKVALAEATARKVEIDALLETQSKAQTQANQFSAQNIELTDQIRVLQREKATAEQNAKDPSRLQQQSNLHAPEDGNLSRSHQSARCQLLPASRRGEGRRAEPDRPLDGNLDRVRRRPRRRPGTVRLPDPAPARLYRQGENRLGLPRQGRRRRHRQHG